MRVRVSAWRLTDERWPLDPAECDSRHKPNGAAHSEILTAGPHWMGRSSGRLLVCETAATSSAFK
jgi:hypothetical protein